MIIQISEYRELKEENAELAGIMKMLIGAVEKKYRGEGMTRAEVTYKILQIKKRRKLEGQRAADNHTSNNVNKIRQYSRRMKRLG